MSLSHPSAVDPEALSAQEQLAVQSSVEALSCSTHDLSRHFYDLLFAEVPEVRVMFPPQMSPQVNKLEQTLVYVISSMSDMESLGPVLDELGEVHTDLGATPEHYDAVGAALIGALHDKVTGWSAEQEAAWSNLYGIVSRRMQAASQRAAAARRSRP